ncbi:hypothetical protein TNCV_1649451 [Trichonephila clavipes]|nr:hypothetical protein TNCV_1649451 [Trichonephila clavipes]
MRTSMQSDKSILGKEIPRSRAGIIWFGQGYFQRPVAAAYVPSSWFGGSSYLSGCGSSTHMLTFHIDDNQPSWTPCLWTTPSKVHTARIDQTKTWKCGEHRFGVERTNTFSPDLNPIDHVLGCDWKTSFVCVFCATPPRNLNDLTRGLRKWYRFHKVG